MFIRTSATFHRNGSNRLYGHARGCFGGKGIRRFLPGPVDQGGSAKLHPASPQWVRAAGRHSPGDAPAPNPKPEPDQIEDHFYRGRPAQETGCPRLGICRPARPQSTGLPNGRIPCANCASARYAFLRNSSLGAVMLKNDSIPRKGGCTGPGCRTNRAYREESPRFRFSSR